MLLAAGTGYDLHLRNVEGKQRIRTINCTTYTSSANQKDNNIKLDIPDSVAKNGITRIVKQFLAFPNQLASGKLTLYSVSNHCTNNLR